MVYELVRKPPVLVASAVRAAVPPGEPKTSEPSATEVEAGAAVPHCHGAGDVSCVPRDACVH